MFISRRGALLAAVFSAGLSVGGPASAESLADAIALASDTFVKQAAGAAPKKVVVVPGRLVNVVV